MSLCLFLFIFLQHLLMKNRETTKFMIESISNRYFFNFCFVFNFFVVVVASTKKVKLWKQTHFWTQHLHVLMKNVVNLHTHTYIGNLTPHSEVRMKKFRFVDIDGRGMSRADV